MEQKQCLSAFAKYSSLNVLGMIGLSCYILADTFFISMGLGARGLTALNLAIPVYSFIHGSGLMIGMGGAAKYSILRGQKESGQTGALFTNAAYLILLFAAVFVCAGLFFSGQITALLGADAQVFELTNTYLRVLLLFAPAFLLNDLFLCFVRNDGAPRLAMCAMLGGSISNIILDYIFIFPLGLGIFGAVLATGIAPLISMLILSGHWRKKQNGFHFVKTAVLPSMVRNILSIGFPSLITELSSGIVIIVFNMIILKLQGNVGVAAYGVIANLSLVAVAVFGGVAQGIQPLVSSAYGRGDKPVVRQVLRYAVVTILVLSGMVYLLIVLFADPITALFNSENNAQLQEIAVSGLKLYFISAPFVGFNVVLSQYFSSVEKNVPAHVISLLRGFFLIIPMAVVLSLSAGITGTWLAFPVTEGLVALLGIVWYRKIRKQ